MKTLKLLIITLFLTLQMISKAKAQEKQNNATWEETIEFIKENLEYFRPIDGNYETSVKVNIENEKIVIETKTEEKEIYGERTSNKKCNIRTTIPISKISSVDYHYREIPKIRLCAKNKFIEVRTVCIKDRNNKSFDSDYNNCIWLGFATEELAIRLVKAFKHLAYLTNEKKTESKF